MVISAAEATTIDIRLTESVTTGAGGVGDRSGLQLRVQTKDGRTGRGETAPIPGTDGPGLEAIAVEIDAWASTAVGQDVGEALEGLAVTSSLARFAIHTALIDLQSQAASLPAANLLRADAPSTVLVNGLVAESNPGAVHARTTDLVALGMTVIKLKVGLGDAAQDVTRIIAASEAAGPDVALRLDANRAWDRETAEKVIGRVGRHRLDYVEDPTTDVADYQGIEEATGVSTALDVPVSTDPVGEIDAAKVAIAVIKPAAVGGIDRVLDIAAARPDLRVIVSSSIDHEVGLAAAVHAAAALPGNNEAHGLSTGNLVRNIAPGLLAARGQIGVPTVGVWPEGGD